MSWEWLGNLKELNGDPGTITSQHTWDWLIDALNDGTWYTPGDTGQYLSAGSGDYYFGGGDSVTKTTSYGLTLRWDDSRVSQYAAGGLDFVTNVPVPGSSSYYGYSLGGLMYYGGFKIAVDHNAEEAIIMLVRVFQNGPYYTTYDWLGQHANHTSRNAIYNFVMGNIEPVHNWLSVQSLTGQGITIQLSTSTDTNNGEAITTSDTTKFALTAESNINKLIVDRLARGN